MELRRLTVNRDVENLNRQWSVTTSSRIQNNIIAKPEKHGDVADRPVSR